jgi:DNA-binding NarL/FixJ family response regulator
MPATRALGTPLDDIHLDILRLAAQGFTSRQIAQRLGRSKAAVDVAATTAAGRLGAHSRTHAVAIAVGAGLIPAPPPTHDTQEPTCA